MTQAQPKYAGISDRLFASTLDLAIVFVIVDFFTKLLFNLYYPNGSAYNYYANLVIKQYPDFAVSPQNILLAISQKYPQGLAEIFNQTLFLSGIQIVLVGLYFVPMTKIYGASLAKRILGMKVVDAITGNKISWAQSFIRFVGYLPSVLLLGMGLISGAVNKKKRCWHDFMADSVVIYDENRWYKRQIDKLKKYFHLS